MAEPEGGKPNPNPEAAKPAAPAAVDATKYVGTPAAGVGRRDRVSDRVVPRFLSIFSSPHFVRAQHGFQDWLPVRVRPGSRHQVSAEIPRLGRSYSGPRIRDLCALHASGLHAGLEAEREQIQ